MLFHTMEFLVFFAVVVIFARLYHGELRKWLLLFASYYFYMAWNPYFAALILGSTLIDYLCGLRIQASTRLPRRRLWLILSLVSNLGLLSLFKYLGLFGDMVNSFMTAFDIDAQVTVWKLTLPVGISFFTFQSMSHTIDVYRRQLDAERSLLHFCL